jgi:hypothetical protein
MKEEVVRLVERLRATDRFVNDPVSLKPRLRNPDGPEAASQITFLTEEVGRLRKALEPFAWAADRYAFYAAEAMPDEMELAFPKFGVPTDVHMPRLCLEESVFAAARTALDTSVRSPVSERDGG